MADRTDARMPAARLTDEMLERMRRLTGTELRIEHSVNNEEVTRIAVAKFAAGIGDINPLWTDAEYARQSPYGASVAPPTFVLACFSGLQFGWPGLGSFHSATRIRFHQPIHWGDTIHPSCRYDGFSGPQPSSFANRMVVDHFTNRYVNDRGELVAEVNWDVVNFEREAAREKAGRAGDRGPQLPHPWAPKQLADLESAALGERPRGADPRWWEDTEVGAALGPLTKGPIGLTDEIAFVAGGGAPIPRLAAHAVALHAYERHPAWAFRDPATHAMEPIYSVHYNRQAASEMGVPLPYDVGFQRQCWQVQHLTHWCSDAGWVKQTSAEYRRFVYLGDAVVLQGTVVDRRQDDDGDYVVEIATTARNQRGEDVMPGRAVVALPSRHAEPGPVGRRARSRRCV
jgi:acyl dehydratase